MNQFTALDCNLSGEVVAPGVRVLEAWYRWRATDPIAAEYTFPIQTVVECIPGHYVVDTGV